MNREGPLSWVTGQWLAALTLTALVASVTFSALIAGSGKLVAEKTGAGMLALQLATPQGKVDTVKSWKDCAVLEDAKRAQTFDFAFPVAYGLFFLFLAEGMRRCYRERWVFWCIVLGFVALFLDEIENVVLWQLLKPNGAKPADFLLLVQTVLSWGKCVLLAVAGISAVAAIAGANGGKPILVALPLALLVLLSVAFTRNSVLVSGKCVELQPRKTVAVRSELRFRIQLDAFV